MSTRELKHPTIEIEDADEGMLRIRFFAPGSRFGAVEVVLTVSEAETLSADIQDAAVFAVPVEGGAA